MKVTVLGKAHLHGISQKTGNPYDCTEIHYLGHRRGVEGQAAIAKFVSADVIKADDVHINQTYDLEYDERGQICALTPCVSKPAQQDRS